MSKIIIREGGIVTPLDSQPFVFESLLEKSIAEVPELIPLETISSDANRFATLGTQWPAGNGAADVVMLASDAILTIVETKLKKNPEARREVVAQVVEYASYISASSVAEIAERAGEAFGEAIAKLVTDPDKVEEFEREIEANLRKGRIRLVVAVDELSEQALNLVTFLNRNSTFEIYLLQVSAFKHGSTEIFIPTLHGYASKSRTSSSSPHARWDEARFFEDLRAHADSETASYASRVYEQFKTWTQETLWGAGSTLGSFNIVRLTPSGKLNVAQITSRGTLYVNFGNMYSRPVGREAIERLYAALEAVDGLTLPASVENRYPPIPTSVLKDPALLDAVLGALDAFIREVSS